jgi:hypothetical protein
MFMSNTLSNPTDNHRPSKINRRTPRTVPKLSPHDSRVA